MGRTGPSPSRSTPVGRSPSGRWRTRKCAGGPSRPMASPFSSRPIPARVESMATGRPADVDRRRPHRARRRRDRQADRRPCSFPLSSRPTRGAVWWRRTQGHVMKDERIDPSHARERRYRLLRHRRGPSGTGSRRGDRARTAGDSSLDLRTLRSLAAKVRAGRPLSAADRQEARGGRIDGSGGVRARRNGTVPRTRCRRSGRYRRWRRGARHPRPTDPRRGPHAADQPRRSGQGPGVGGSPRRLGPSLLVARASRHGRRGGGHGVGAADRAVGGGTRRRGRTVGRGPGPPSRLVA